MSHKPIILAAIALVLSACTSVKVRQPTGMVRGSNVCIVNNPKVAVPDFVDIVRDGFNRHGYLTTVVNEQEAKACTYTLTYTALRSWDMATYLSHAELRLWQGGSQIGYAEYHLKGKGGLSLAKWKGAKSKMDPVIDQLLSSSQ